MNIIKLTKGQKRLMKVEHPLLDNTKLMTDEQVIDAWGANDKDGLIMGHFFFIKIIVGRFLAHWPETRRFEEDMVSEGLVAVTETVNKVMEAYRLPEDFQATVWTKIRVGIEIMLNRDRSLFAPGTTKQWEEVKAGREPIYNYAKQFNENLEGGAEDPSLEFIDILDELEHLTEEDRENFQMIVYRCMERDHNILESDLTEDEVDRITNITKAITEL